MKKIKAKYQGNDVEVEVPDEVILPEEAGNYITKEFMTAEIAKRIAQAKRGLVDPAEFRESVLGEDDFKAKALAAWGVVPGKGRVSDEEISKLKATLEKEAVEPLAKKLSEREAELNKLYTRDRDLQILEAARAAGVMEMWLTPPVEGQPAPIINVLAPYFGQSPDHGNGWFLKDKDTFAYAKNPSQAAPFKTVAEFVPEFVSAESRSKTFLADTRQRVPSGKTPSAPQTPGTVNKRDPIAFGQQLEAIASGKVTPV